MKTIIAAAVLLTLTACASQMPLRMRPDVRAQAADICADHSGLDKIQPRSKDGGGNYWVRCTDASMHLVSITHVKAR